MNVSTFPVSPFVETTYILWTGDDGDAVIVDPGMMASTEREMIEQFISAHRLNVKYILITHYHIDHVSSACWAKKRFGALILSSNEDESMGSTVAMQAHFFRLRLDVENPKADRHLRDGDVLKLGDEEIHAISTPGHSPASLSYYVPQSNFVITGDTLFSSSIGRTDLPGGNHDTLIDSIKQKLFTLPPDTMVYPGHGSATTIGEEMRFNPYF